MLIVLISLFEIDWIFVHIAHGRNDLFEFGPFSASPRRRRSAGTGDGSFEAGQKPFMPSLCCRGGNNNSAIDERDSFLDYKPGCR
jgi:hypothetical protein